jgi:hypothetical protein
VKVNGKEMPSPPPKMMDKISRAQRFASSQKNDTLQSNAKFEGTQDFGFSGKPLKFEMRDQL